MSSDLGISHDGVSQLAEMGLLDVLEHPSHFMRYNVHQTTQASFARLTADVLANRSSIPKDECIRVAQAMKAVGGRFKPWGPALQAFLNGDIAYAVDDVRGQFVDRIRIRVKDARRVASLVYSAPKPQRLAPATMMSKADAMEVLNIASKQVTELFADVPTMKGDARRLLLSSTSSPWLAAASRRPSLPRGEVSRPRSRMQMPCAPVSKGMAWLASAASQPRRSSGFENLHNIKRVTIISHAAASD